MTAQDLAAKYTSGKWVRNEKETDEHYEYRVNGSRLALERGRAASAETRARQAAERHAQADPLRKPRRSASADTSSNPRASQGTKTPSLQLRLLQDSGENSTTNATPSQATAANTPLTQQP